MQTAPTTHSSCLSPWKKAGEQLIETGKKLNELTLSLAVLFRFYAIPLENVIARSRFASVGFECWDFVRGYNWLKASKKVNVQQTERDSTEIATKVLDMSQNALILGNYFTRMGRVFGTIGQTAVFDLGFTFIKIVTHSITIRHSIKVLRGTDHYSKATREKIKELQFKMHPNYGADELEREETRTVLKREITDLKEHKFNAKLVLINQISSLALSILTIYVLGSGAGAAAVLASPTILVLAACNKLYGTCVFFYSLRKACCSSVESAAASG